MTPVPIRQNNSDSKLGVLQFACLRGGEKPIVVQRFVFALQMSNQASYYQIDKMILVALSLLAPTEAGRPPSEHSRTAPSEDFVAFDSAGVICDRTNVDSIFRPAVQEESGAGLSRTGCRRPRRARRNRRAASLRPGQRLSL